MKKRLITAGVGLIVFIPFVIFSNTFLWEIFAAILSVAGTFELLRALKVINKPEISVPSLIYSALTPLFFGTHARSLLDGALLFVCLTLFLSMIIKRRVAPERVCFALIFVVYVTCAFASLVTVRRVAWGSHIFFVIFVGAWITDTAAYFTGKALGKHPLCPEVSPHKTV